MSNLRIEFEWQDPGAARGEELRATWASLSILIDVQPVTEFLDEKTRSVRNSIFLPLFPLAEWIADNWWFLQSEVERPETSASVAFDSRHNLRWAREGFVLPSLRFVPLGEHVAAQWQTLRIPGAAVRFLGSGSAILNANAVAEKLREFVHAVLTRLDEAGVKNSTLHEQWLAIEHADADEQQFCLAAARLGLDPYAIEDSLATTLVDVSASLPSELLHDFLSMADAGDLSAQSSALRMASESIAENSDKADPLALLRAKIPTFHRNDNPKFILAKSRPDSQQFAFCRALFEHLTQPHERFATVSRLRTERQQMNRAFTAEFLAPHTMLAEDLSSSTVGEEEIENLAADYGVSAFVIRHQIENHRIARVAI